MIRQLQMTSNNFKRKLILSLWKIDLIKEGKLKYIILPLTKILPLDTIPVNDGFINIKIKQRCVIKIFEKKQIISIDSNTKIPSTDDIVKGTGYDNFFNLYRYITKGRETLVNLPKIKWLYIIEQQKEEKPQLSGGCWY